MGIELLQQFLERATASGSRSTVLTELRWLVAILIPGMIIASSCHAPVWMVVMLAILSCLSVISYLAAYKYFAEKNPDSLRSEKFTLSKIAIENSLIGDDEVGLFDPTNDSKKLFGAPSEQAEDDEEDEEDEVEEEK